MPKLKKGSAKVNIYNIQHLVVPTLLRMLSMPMENLENLIYDACFYLTTPSPSHHTSVCFQQIKPNNTWQSQADLTSTNLDEV